MCGPLSRGGRASARDMTKESQVPATGVSGTLR
jgi:hypothetical protein